MKLLRVQDRIAELLSIFVAQIKGATAMRRTDINVVSEIVLIPLFAAVYGYKNLKNLNFTDEANYPGIDLGDEVEKIAFQVTSTPGSEKVKETLRKFGQHELYRKYKRLIIYVLTEKQNSYSGKGYDEIIQGKFTFNTATDIWDYRDLLATISSLQIGRTRKIQNILEANFGEGSTPLLHEVEELQTETVYLNLLEIFFPDTFYISDLALDRTKIIENSWDNRFTTQLRHDSSTRDVVRAALEQGGLRFSVDWECHANQILTFHNLFTDTVPLKAVINEKATRALSPQEYYEKDESHERVFKSLLGRCMQQKLFYEQIL